MSAMLYPRCVLKKYVYKPKSDKGKRYELSSKKFSSRTVMIRSSLEESFAEEEVYSPMSIV